MNKAQAKIVKNKYKIAMDLYFDVMKLRMKKGKIHEKEASVLIKKLQQAEAQIEGAEKLLDELAEHGHI